MTITVIGHLCFDVIHPASGSTEIHSYGGIFFSLAALANLADPDITVLPVFGVGKDDYVPFMETIQHYGNVDPSGIFKFDGPTNRVHLYYRDEQQRTECSKHIADPIPFKKIKPYLDTDMVLINMVSGFDITLDTLDHIRMFTRDQHIPIYFDVHSLSLGIDRDESRFRRPLPEWRRWLFWLHTVQMNEEEARGLTNEVSSEEQLIKHITALTTPNVVITRGENGCTLYHDERKNIVRHVIPGVAVATSVDATGCGDVFGAAYCAKFLASGNPLQAVQYANTVAAFNSTIAGSAEIDRLAQYKLPQTIHTTDTVTERVSL